MEIIKERSLKAFIENYPVTTIIAIVITVIHILTYIYGNGPSDIETARKFGALLSSNKDITELPYMLTSTYQHIGGMTHYLFNISSLLISAPFLERLFGAVRFTIIFNLTGIIGSGATLYFMDNVISSGASGALYGLIGVYVALLVKQHPWLNGEVKQRVLPVLIYGLIFTFLVPNVSITGHIGGLIAGILIGMVVKPKPYPPKKRFNKKTISQFIIITVGMWVALISPSIIINNEKLIATYSQNGFNLFDIPISENINGITSKYDEIASDSSDNNNDMINEYEERANAELNVDFFKNDIYYSSLGEITYGELLEGVLEDTQWVEVGDHEISVIGKIKNQSLADLINLNEFPEEYRKDMHIIFRFAFFSDNNLYYETTVNLTHNGIQTRSPLEVGTAALLDALYEFYLNES